MKFSCVIIVLLALVGACQEEKPLRQKIGDSAPGDRWIYDDWIAAKSQSESSGKPIMVVFRCVP
ncbi:MAG: hypothetical protein ACI97A_001017 [Planctomycetota bacterium]|jgi:hypothetical protein